MKNKNITGPLVRSVFVKLLLNDISVSVVQLEHVFFPTSVHGAPPVKDLHKLTFTLSPASRSLTVMLNVKLYPHPSCDTFAFGFVSCGVSPTLKAFVLVMLEFE